jgi:hypothetical protein
MTRISIQSGFYTRTAAAAEAVRIERSEFLLSDNKSFAL